MTTSYQTLCNLFQDEQRTTLRKQLTTRYHWSTARANQAITQYLMFLALAAERPDLPLVPTADIDCVWEADILHNTARYQQRCHRLCGNTIHHADGAEMERKPGFETLESTFSQTKRLFTQHFGQPATHTNPDATGILSQGAHHAACGVLIRSH